MIEKLFQLLSFKCRHQNLSKPFAAASAVERYSADRPWQSVGSGASHYVVCLDCGQKFSYDWEHMKVITRKGA